MKILLIDDHLMFAASLSTMLSVMASVVHVQSAGEALTLVDRQGFDLILLDITLPDLDGIALLRQLVRRINKPPVLILSGSDDPTTLTRAR